MKTRHILILLLVFVIIIASGCSGNSEPTESAAEEHEETPEPVAGEEEAEEQVQTEELGPEEEPELVWSHKHDNKLESVAVSPDGQSVAVGGFEAAYIHDLAGGSLANVLEYEHGVEDIEFSKEGTLLGAGLGYFGVLLSDVAGAAEPQTIGSGYNSRLAFSPDGLFIATGNRDGVVWIWQLGSLTQTATLENPDVAAKAVTDRWLLAIDYHPSGELLATTHTDGTIYIWDVEKEEAIQSLQYGADVTASNAFRFSPSGNEMAVAVTDSGKQLIRLYEVDSGAVLQDFEVPERLMNLNFSPDGSLLAVASRLATTIWDTSSGMLLHTLDQSITPPDDTPHALAFTPDGEHLAVARWDGTIELWALNR